MRLHRPGQERVTGYVRVTTNEGRVFQVLFFLRSEELGLASNPFHEPQNLLACDVESDSLFKYGLIFGILAPLVS